MINTQNHRPQKWGRRRGFGTRDGNWPVVVPEHPFGKATGEWFCSVCFRKWPTREKHGDCLAETKDMDAVVKPH
jgi:hypothetical protein